MDKGQRHNIVRSYNPRVSNPRRGGISQLQRSSSKTEVSEFHIRLALFWEDVLSESLALKASGAYVWESRQAIGNRETAFKGYAQNLIHSVSWQRWSSLK